MHNQQQIVVEKKGSSLNDTLGLNRLFDQLIDGYTYLGIIRGLFNNHYTLKLITANYKK